MEPHHSTNPPRSSCRCVAPELRAPCKLHVVAMLAVHEFLLEDEQARAVLMCVFAWRIARPWCLQNLTSALRLAAMEVFFWSCASDRKTTTLHTDLLWAHHTHWAVQGRRRPTSCLFLFFSWFFPAFGRLLMRSSRGHSGARRPQTTSNVSFCTRSPGPPGPQRTLVHQRPRPHLAETWDLATPETLICSVERPTKFYGLK